MDIEKQVDAAYWANKAEDIFKPKEALKANLEPYTPKQWEHLNHDFYKQAAEHREGVRMGQILKGAAKYPTPFDPFEWTPKQLLEHAIQENVDQGHYEYGLYLWIERLEKERDAMVKDFKTQQDTIVKYMEMIERLEQEKNSFEALLNRAEKERNELKERLVEVLEEREGAREDYARIKIKWDGTKKQLVEAVKEWDKYKAIIGEKNTHIAELEKDLTVANRNVDWCKNEIEILRKITEQPEHECSKNQIITWNGHPGRNEIKTIHCGICKKKLFEASNGC